MDSWTKRKMTEPRGKVTGQSKGRKNILRPIYQCDITMILPTHLNMNTPQSASTERSISTPSGWLLLIIVLALILTAAAWFLTNVTSRHVSVPQAFGAALMFAATMVLTKGF